MAGKAVELDVRPFHARGEEPFGAIMEAVRSLGPEDSLILWNSFEPLPLYGVMARLGFGHRSEEVAPGVWRVVFRREATGGAGGPAAGGAGGAPAAAPAGAASAAAPAAGIRVVELDNRGLEPPEPMLRVLEAAADLRPGDRLVVRNDRRPLFLYPELAARGLRHHTEDLPDGSVRLVIWKE